MRTKNKETTVYNFNELSKEAKQVVKNWYLEEQEPTFFSEDCKGLLLENYGITELDIQYSLGYSQGDGLCMCGTIQTYNDTFFNIITEGYNEAQKEHIKENLYNIRFVKFNHYYSHSKTVHIEFDYADSIEDMEINTDILENNVRRWYFEKCADFEKNG